MSAPQPPSHSHQQQYTPRTAYRPPPPRFKPRRPHRLVAGPLILFVAALFVSPFVYTYLHNNKPNTSSHYLSEAALPRQSQIRGAFLNSGSKDVGKDEEFYQKHGEAIRAITTDKDKQIGKS